MEKIVLFAPLVGSLLAGFGWRMIGEKAADMIRGRTPLPRAEYALADAGTPAYAEALKRLSTVG